MMRSVVLLSVLVLALLVAACSRPTPSASVPVEIDGYSTEVVLETEPFRDVVDYSAFGNDEFASYEAVEGVTSSGAEFVLYKPSEWNSRDLVLYAHGYVPPGEPVGYGSEIPRDLAAFRDGLVCGGYALGASSYSANGFAIEEGAKDTHLLNPIFNLVWEEPDRTFVVGASLGGAVTIKLAELFPERYDGALPICGMIGGSRLQLAYVGSVALMYRTFFPDVLGPQVTLENPEALFSLPADLPQSFGSIEDNLIAPDPTTVAGRIVAAAHANPNALEQIARVQVLLQHPVYPSQVLGPFPLVQAIEEQNALEALLRALHYYVSGLADIQSRAGGQPFDSDGIEYLLDAQVLAVPTYQLDPEVTRYLNQNYQPTGVLRIPTLSVHNTADPDTPYLHVLLYEDLLEIWGRQDNFLAVPVPRFGHCNFSPLEVAAAFGALEEWARTGQKPSVQGASATLGL